MAAGVTAITEVFDVKSLGVDLGDEPRLFTIGDDQQFLFVLLPTIFNIFVEVGDLVCRDSRDNRDFRNE